MSPEPALTPGGFPRRAGVLLHISSLPGPHGIGDLGPGAVDFLDWLAAAGQRLWQVLPLNPVGYGNSPYSSPSAFARNPLLLSPEFLAADGFLERRELEKLVPLPEGRTDYPAVSRRKEAILEQAYLRFRREGGAREKGELAAFRREHPWLENYALFSAIKKEQEGRPWFEWPEALARRRSAEVAAFEDKWQNRLELKIFAQYLFSRQWENLRREATRRGIALVGDIPIFVSHDSADVWAHRDLFQVDSTGARLALSGAPPKKPNYVSQIWGSPLYDWEKMAADGYSWWRARFAAALEMMDVIRVDHFSGFYACWRIPPGARTSAEGEWELGPGAPFFQSLEESLGRLPILAEAREPEIYYQVEDLMRELGYAGIRGIQYAFDGNPRNSNLPENFPAHCAANSGTHDDDTITGWYANIPEQQRRRVDEYLSGEEQEGINWKMISILDRSAADTILIPLPDVLGLGPEARMNHPGQPQGQWEWRFCPGSLDDRSARRLADLAAATGRS